MDDKVSRMPGLPARRAAVALVAAVLDDGRTLDSAGADLPPEDRARAERLARTTLRRLGQIDGLLQGAMRKAPARGVLHVLRMALADLHDGAPAHAAVNAAVALVRENRRTAGQAGLVNAVLRGVADGGDPLAGRPVPHLPQWLRQPMVRSWGRGVADAVEAAHLEPPPLDLSVRAMPVPEGMRLPNGTLRLTDPGRITGLPGYAEGAWWVQDAAASMAVPLLNPAPGEAVLDLCAAPGGKTMQLAALGARVTAVDASAPRMARLAENLARTGLTAQTVVADLLTWEPAGPQTAILLDAPCSATGTIRRHPELPWIKDGSDLPALCDLQARLIDRAAGWLAPGGRMVFATCSLLPAEGEEQLAAALARHPGLHVVPPAMPWVDPAWITPQGGLRLTPARWGGMDGFFMACIQRPYSP
jgi:16S rRNA (cytosine967-C5)-methyltransferase